MGSGVPQEPVVSTWGVHLLEKSLGTFSSLEKLSDLWSPVMPMCLCVSVCTCVCVNMHACVHLYVQLSVCLHKYINVCVLCVCLNVCCVYICHVYIYVCLCLLTWAGALMCVCV